MKRYRLSRRAKADLDRIWLRVAREASIEIADRFIDAITERFPTLAGMPEAGKAQDELEPGLRSFPMRDYVIYYRKAHRGRILISRVIHGRRDQKKALEEDDI